MPPGWRVTKAIDFCYGHRLVRHGGKCRHLHGHNGLVEVEVAAKELDEQKFVVDFETLRDLLKRWIDEHLDHRMILSRHDPLVPVLEKAGEPLYLMDEDPTAENLARLIFRVAREHKLTMREVHLWETPSSCATYTKK